jgi:hypothetical protein
VVGAEVDVMLDELRAAARRFLAQGYALLPVNGKRPWDVAVGAERREWNSYTLTEATLDVELGPGITGLGLRLGEGPYCKKAAARLLTVVGLTWKQAYEAVARGNGTHWRLEEQRTTWGHPIVLVPVNSSRPRSRGPDPEVPVAQGLQDSLFGTPAPGADVPKSPNGNPCVARGSEGPSLERGGKEKTPAVGVKDVLGAFPGARQLGEEG